jgi:hypothetical protein
MKSILSFLSFLFFFSFKHISKFKFQINSEIWVQEDPHAWAEVGQGHFASAF